MSRPFDDTKQWWRDELRALGQIVHQLHLDENLVPKGTWQTCTMASCSRIRAIIDESKRDIGVTDIAIEDIVSIKVRRER